MTVSTPEINRFDIVDFDRTLVDSDKLLEVFMEIANDYYNIPREQIEKADRDVKLKGDSFDTASFVRDHLLAVNEEDGVELWNKLQKQYIHECRALNMLLPGAAELLEQLAANDEHFGILTYGNPLWQGIKLTASGFNHVPHIVMEHKEKGRFIKHWQQEDGTFKMPAEFGGIAVSRVVLIDDKAVSFAEYPEEPSEGYWVLDQSSEVLPSQMGEVPPNVRNVKDLFEVAKNLFN